MISEYGGAYEGSFITALTELENYLTSLPDDEGYEVVYVFPEACRTFEWFCKMQNEGKKLYTYSDKSTLGGLKLIRNIVKKEGISLIHTHFGALGHSVFLFRLISRKIPVVWHIRNDFSHGNGALKRLERRIKDFLIYKFTTAISISKHLQVGNEYLVYEPLVLSRIPDDWKNKSAYIKDYLKIPGDSKIILMFGWNKRVKGVDIACRMMDHLPDTLRGKTHLCIVARDDCENLKYVSENCSTPEYVHFLPLDNDVFKYHCSADVLLSASRSEAFSNAILEAMSVGTQVVSSDIPGVRWSKKYGNVRYFENGNPKSCAEAIAAGLTDTGTEVNIEIAEKVRSDFESSGWCLKISKIYSKLLDNNS